MYAKAVFRGGHVGRGKYHEMTRYLVVNNMLDVFGVARIMPRVKKNNLALISCEQINRLEYLEGKLRETQDPYLNTFKHKVHKGVYSYAQEFHTNTA